MSTDRRQLLSGYVIRGSEEMISDDFAQRLGYAFALVMAEKKQTTTDKLTVAVGHDARPSGKRIMRALIDGITAADSDIYDCGLATTPAIQMCIYMPEIAADGSIMVTGGSADEGINGFKFFTADGIFSAEEAAALYELAQHVKVPHRLVEKLDVFEIYKKRLRDHVFEFMGTDVAMPLLGLKVIVDASNGSAGFFADFLSSLGADTTGSINLEPTGKFGFGAPKLEQSESLKALCAKVLESGADLGVIFDGDGDSVAIVDANGKVINRNRLIALVAAIMLEDEKDLTFVTDSVTSSGLSRFITEWGGTHYRYKRGYRNIIDEARKMSEEGCKVPVAMETSGHAAMQENNFIDDGMYLATKVICEAMWRKRDGLTLFSLIDDLQDPCETLEVRLPIVQEDYKTAAGYVIEGLLSKTLSNPEWRLASDNREGVRIMFTLSGKVDCAWFMLRLSAHDPVIVVNAESEVEGGLAYITKQLYEELARDNEELDLSPLRAQIDQLSK